MYNVGCSCCIGLPGLVSQAPPPAAPEPGVLPPGEPDDAGLSVHQHGRPVPQGEGPGRLPLRRLRLAGDVRMSGPSKQAVIIPPKRKTRKKTPPPYPPPPQNPHLLSEEEKKFVEKKEKCGEVCEKGIF